MSKKKKKRKDSGKTELERDVVEVDAEMFQAIITEMEMLGQIRDAARMIVDTAQDGRVPLNMVEAMQNMLTVYDSVTAFPSEEDTKEIEQFDFDLDRENAIKLVVWNKHETLQSAEAKAYRDYLERLSDDELTDEMKRVLNDDEG